MHDLYLKRYAYYKTALIKEPPPADPAISIVIPCYDEPDMLPTLHSLMACERPGCAVEVIIVVNQSPEERPSVVQHNQHTILQINDIAAQHPDWDIHLLQELALPKTHAGVGLARKIGMDEAIRRNPDGIIVCLDADTLVQPNYLTEIEQHFKQHESTPGCSIYFEHPLEGAFEPEIYQAITAYELHLRYFIDAQRWAGHPHAYQTIGSSMAVRSPAYCKVGGMPKKKAGEDFYFLQKVIQQGQFTELNSTTVIPSPRISDRVPFGTGKAVSDKLLHKEADTTYHFDTFRDLRAGLGVLDHVYAKEYHLLPESLYSFFEAQNGFVLIEKIIRNSPSFERFTVQFFNWFNAFQVMKYTHFCRDHFYDESLLSEQCSALLAALNEETSSNDLVDHLKRFRKIDKTYNA